MLLQLSPKHSKPTLRAINQATRCPTVTATTLYHVLMLVPCEKKHWRIRMECV